MKGKFVSLISESNVEANLKKGRYGVENPTSDQHHKKSRVWGGV